jgi:hypothetical protein
MWVHRAIPTAVGPENGRLCQRFQAVVRALNAGKMPYITTKCPLWRRNIRDHVRQRFSVPGRKDRGVHCGIGGTVVMVKRTFVAIKGTFCSDKGYEKGPGDPRTADFAAIEETRHELSRSALNRNGFLLISGS